MSAPGVLKQAWFKWKQLRLPWRKTFLVGCDLSGNTFWEFRDALRHGRWRRIVQYRRRTHYADVEISPQWHQWLRHTRPEAPSVREQQHEASRQAAMKRLAAEADERWKRVPAVAAPETTHRAGGPDVVAERVVTADDAAGVGRAGSRETERGPTPSPWVQRRPKGNPGEEWQPEGWTPGVAHRR